MKTTRKILALLMALTLCLAIAAPAFADATDYQIIIDNAVDGETYTAYKIFDVTYANPVSPAPSVDPETDIPGAPDEESMYGAYSYTISTASPWWDIFYADGYLDDDGVLYNYNFDLVFTPTTTPGVYIVSEDGYFSPETLADNLRWYLYEDGQQDTPVLAPTAAATVTAHAAASAEGITPAYSANMTNTTTHGDYYTTGRITLNVGNSGAGYYFVDTSMGSLCSLDTTEPSATIREKNSLPTQEKTVSDAVDGRYGASTSASIGDTVYFGIDVTDGVGTDGELIVHDTMSSGLTLDPDSFTVDIWGDESIIYLNVPAIHDNGTPDDPEDDIVLWTLNTSPDDGCTFEIVFSADFMSEVYEDAVFTISYEATVNENAVIAGEGNPNTSRVEYSNQMTPDSTAIVYTYAGAIYKVDGTATSGTAPELAGATFAVTIDHRAQSAGSTDSPFPDGKVTPPGLSEVEVPSPTFQLDTTPVPPSLDPSSASSPQPVPLTQISAGSATAPAIYRYDPDGDPTDNIIVTPASGAVVLLGFADGTVLTLTETAAPTGYNLLAAPVTLTISATNADTANKSATVTGGATATFVATTYSEPDPVTGEITATSGDDATYQIHADSIDIIENLAGSELPSTGGIGTTIFIIAGSILVLGAGIILVAMSVSKRREEN